MKSMSRNYNSDHSILPLPELHTDSGSQTFLMLTNWGEKASTEEIKTLILNSLGNSALLDSEEDETRPFPLIENYSAVANQMSNAFRFANDELWRKNYDDFQFGLECLVGIYHQSTLSLAFVGNHCIYSFDQDGELLNPIICLPDFSAQFRQSSPLTSDFLGAGAHIQPHVVEFKAPKIKGLIISSRPLPINAIKNSNPQLEDLARLLIQQNENLPFSLQAILIR